MAALDIRELTSSDPSLVSAEQDWTSKYNGSVNALRKAIESRAVTLPVGGVVLRSKRLSEARERDVYFRFTSQRLAQQLAAKAEKYAPNIPIKLVIKSMLPMQNWTPALRELENWTEKFNGSVGALRAHLRAGKIVLPPGGVVIRSLRRSMNEGHDVHFHVHAKETDPSTTQKFKWDSSKHDKSLNKLAATGYGATAAAAPRKQPVTPGRRNSAIRNPKKTSITRPTSAPSALPPPLPSKGVCLSIDKMPVDFKPVVGEHVDWTDKFDGSTGVLQRSVEAGKIQFPPGVAGVYIRSKRMSKQTGRPVYYFVGHSSGVCEKSLLTSVYGRSITSGLMPNKRNLPRAIKHLVQFLKKEACCETEGIFRVPADGMVLNQAKDAIDDGHLPDFIKSMLRGTDDMKIMKRSVHVAAGLFKLFYRLMPEPLIPFEAYDALTTAQGHDELERVFKEQLPRWPQENQMALLHLLDFLTYVSEHQESNLMGKGNLAMVFAPSIFRKRDASPMDELTTIKDRVDRVSHILNNYQEKGFFVGLA